MMKTLADTLTEYRTRFMDMRPNKARWPYFVSTAQFLANDIAGVFALVQPGLTPATKVGIFQPVEHEQRALHLAHLLQGEMELVLPLISGELLQHGRGRRVAEALNLLFERYGEPPIARA